MTTRHLFFVPLLTATSFLFGQGAAVQWKECYGGGFTEQGKGQPTSDGGLILAATTASTNGDVSGFHGTTDMWIVKLDAQGVLQWQRTLGGSEADEGSFAIQTNDGGYLAVGSTNSTDGDIAATHGGVDAWVVKLDGTGALEWQRTLGGDSSDVFNAVRPTSDGGFVLAGYTLSNNGDASGNHGMADFWVVRLDATGNTLWQSSRGGPLDDNACSIDVTSDGGSIVTGYANSTNGEITGWHGGTDIWVVKLDDLGAIQWQRSLGGTSADIAGAIKQTGDGGFIFIGSTRSHNGDVSMNHSNSSIYDVWVVKLDPNGTIEWEKTYGGTDVDKGNDITPWDGGYLIAASAGSTDDDVTGHHGSSYYMDAWVAAIDADGDLIWQRSLGGTGQDEGLSIHANLDGSMFLAGVAGSTDGDVSGGHGQQDLWALKLNTHFNSITGKVFADLNSNSTYDPGEPLLADHSVAITADPLIAWTNSAGVYELNVFQAGSFVIAPAPLSHYTAVPATRTAQFTGLNQVDSLNNFKFQPVGPVNDLAVSMAPTSAFRPGMEGRYVLRCTNVGTTALQGTLVFHPDPNTTFSSASVQPTSISADSIVWELSTMAPFDAEELIVNVLVDQSVAIGTILTSSTVLYPPFPDAAMTDNSATWNTEVTGSFDPNTILVNRASVMQDELASPPELDYIINFQNAGNDTAFTVSIVDPVPTNADFGSFHFINASHPVNIAYNATTNRLIFRFEHILLPDSSTDGPGSHGYVHYRIEPRSNLMVGDEILNQASIFFDYNEPVMTNTAQTLIEQSTIVEETYADQGFTVQPNPATASVRIGWEGEQARVTLTVSDVCGRPVHQVSSSGQRYSLDTADLPRGVYLVSLHSPLGERTQRLVLE